MITLNSLTRPEEFLGVQGIIFDCDGVLIDSEHANTFYYNTYKEHFGLDPMTQEEINYVHAHHVWESLKFILPDEYYEDAVRRKQGFDYRDVLPHIRLAPGLMDFLQFVRGLGIPMGIATSRTDTLDLVIDYFGLEGFFSPCITSFKVTRPKPNPESIFAVLDHWRMDKSDVVFIGDSSVDENTAINADIRFWSFQNPMLESAQLLVPDFQTLKNALDRADRLGYLWI